MDFLLVETTFIPHAKSDLWGSAFRLEFSKENSDVKKMKDLKVNNSREPVPQG